MSISSLRAAYRICESSDWTVTIIKLQEILYLANMVYLHRHQKPLISDSFEAGKYGPVLPILYDKVKRFGNEAIPKFIFNPDLKNIDDAGDKNALKEAWEKLGNKSVSILIGMTHRKNGACEKTFEKGKNKIITNDLIIQEMKEIIG